MQGDGGLKTENQSQQTVNTSPTLSKPQRTPQASWPHGKCDQLITPVRKKVCGPNSVMEKNVISDKEKEASLLLFF